METKYKEGNNLASYVKLKSLVRKHNKTGNKSHTQINTDTREPQASEYKPGNSKLHLLWPRTRRVIRVLPVITFEVKSGLCNVHICRKQTKTVNQVSSY